jgi:hypothetical protein
LDALFPPVKKCGQLSNKPIKIRDIIVKGVSHGDHIGTASQEFPAVDYSPVDIAPGGSYSIACHPVHFHGGRLLKRAAAGPSAADRGGDDRHPEGCSRLP